MPKKSQKKKKSQQRPKQKKLIKLEQGNTIDYFGSKYKILSEPKEDYRYYIIVPESLTDDCGVSISARALEANAKKVE
jgi:hypothetical protein